MATLVAAADAATGTVRIDIDQMLVRDLFTRVVANGWGNATTGQAYTTSGGAAGDYSVNGTQGIHSVGAVNSVRSTFLTASAGPDTIETIQVTIAVLATGAAIQPSLMIRRTDASNYYFAELSLAPTTNVATLKIRKVVLGVTSDVTTTAVTLGQVHAAGATWNISAGICGKTIMAKAWRSTVTEPDWLLTAVDSDLTTGVQAGPRSLLATGNTNGLPVLFTYDNYAVGISQPIRLRRVDSAGNRVEVRGSPGSTTPIAADATLNPGTATFYDGEVPFDEVTFYELTSNCSLVVEATSNNVTLLSNGDGWLRDPQDPSRNLLIDFSGDPFDYCDESNQIVFGGLGSRGYANASGIYDIIDSQRPSTVSMTRKRYGSTLILISKTLDDIDDIEAIIAPGRILLLSLPVEYGFGRPTGTDYITIDDIPQDTIGVDQRLEARTWEFPFRLSHEPGDTHEGGTGGNGLGVPGATYADLAASALGVTYANLAASGETYLQVAQGVGY
jgi:hypothetical protein